MPPENQKKYYLTTPIYYVNARPHIGHAYTTIVADVLARRHRLLGEDVFFLTGTDEHGQKIERSAAAAGIPPQQFADQVSAQFRTLWDRMGLTYDRYIRTTDERHKQGVQKLFRTLYERGYIYLSTYTGAYCVSDEAFVDAPVGTPCPDCGRLLEEVTEENFFFKLSEFQKPLLDLIESGQLSVEPESRRNEVLSFVRGGLKDLSVSRSSFTWGIPVPKDVQQEAGATQNHIVYVWLDALANYITAIGYGATEEQAQAEFAKYWPAELQLVGKEIIRFHCVYWPAFLLAAGLPLPKAVTAHGWLLFDNSKMSKSKGNIVRTETILEAFGTLCPPVHAAVAYPGSPAEGAGAFRPLNQEPDKEGASAPQGSASGPEVRPPTSHERDLFASDVLRYFLLREIPFGQDGSFSFDALITRYNADLANGYGNLVSRTLKLVEQNCPSGWEPVEQPWLFPTMAENTTSDEEATASTAYLWDYSLDAMDSNDSISWPKNLFSDVLEQAMSHISHADRYLSFHKPWILAKSDDPLVRRRLIEVLHTVAEVIRLVTAALYPLLPYATSRVWSQLGLGDIEQAAANGELYWASPSLVDENGDSIEVTEFAKLQWGSLQPGTKLGPLAPIFPRADKGLAQLMTDMENNARPEAPLKEAATPATAAPVPADPTHPAAPPVALDEPSGALPVAGSTAHTTGPDATPSHKEAPASGIFAQQSSGPSALGPGLSDASPQITIDDFAKVELRVAEIKVCERIPKADKLLRLEVDLGHEQRQILSGIAEYYAPEDLIGRRIIVITNLAPRKMRGLDSHGMLLAASGPDGGKPILATVGEGVPLGARLK